MTLADRIDRIAEIDLEAALNWTIECNYIPQDVLAEMEGSK